MKVGDIVTLRSGSPLLTVVAVGTEVEVAWFETSAVTSLASGTAYTAVRTWKFPADALRQVEP